MLSSDEAALSTFEPLGRDCPAVVSTAEGDDSVRLSDGLSLPISLDTACEDFCVLMRLLSDIAVPCASERAIAKHSLPLSMFWLFSAAWKLKDAMLAIVGIMSTCSAEVVLAACTGITG